MPRVLPDSNDVCVWLCNESGSQILNSGVAGSAGDLTLSGSGFLPGSAPSVFGETALVTPGSTSDKTYYASAAPASTTVEPALPLSLSGWAYIRTPLAGSGFFISPHKAYRAAQNSWSAPFAWGMVSNNNATTWSVSIITGGTQTVLTVQDNFAAPIGRWAHYGMTYDGVNLRAYLNGDLANSTSRTGAVDYGTHGPWVLGGNWSSATAAGEQGACIRCDWRLANVARSQSYFKNIYLRGLYGFGESTLQRYYRLQATDLACNPPQHVRWTDTQYSLANAPPGPCGTPGTSLANLKILDTWEQ